MAHSKSKPNPKSKFPDKSKYLCGLKRKYLIPIPAAGGCYGVTIGIVKNILNRIKYKTDPKDIYFSGISSGSVCATLFALSLIYNYDIDVLHTEYMNIVRDKTKQYDTIIDYYKKNNAFYECIKILLDKYVRDISDINGRIHIGYASVSNNCIMGLDFNIVSHFDDVDDLYGAICASSHYPILLKKELYYEYRGKKCIDGAIMYDYIHLENYKNIIIDSSILTKVNTTDVLLDCSEEKYHNLYNTGLQHQKQQKIASTRKTNITSNRKSRLWGIMGII